MLYILMMRDIMTDSIRSDCPECGGTNSYTENVCDGIKKWNCYRSSCNNRGAAWIGKCNDTKYADFHKAEQTDIGKIDLIRKNTRNIFNSYIGMEYLKQFEIMPFLNKTLGTDSMGCMWDGLRNRVIFMSGTTAVGRAIGDAKPKWFKYTKTIEPFMCAFRHRGLLIIVEDAISAAVIGGNVCDCLALLGTTFHNEYLTYIKKYDRILIALDADAYDKALLMQRKLDMLIPTSVMRLKNDLKYYSKEELCELKDKIL